MKEQKDLEKTNKKGKIINKCTRCGGEHNDYYCVYYKSFK